MFHSVIISLRGEVYQVNFIFVLHWCSAYFHFKPNCQGAVLVTNVLNGFIEMVGAIFLIAIVDKKWCHRFIEQAIMKNQFNSRNLVSGVFYGMAGVFLILAAIASVFVKNGENSLIVLVLTLIGRAGAWNAFCLIYVYTTGSIYNYTEIHQVKP